MKKPCQNSGFAEPVSGWTWDVKKYAIHDGPGIRTTVFLKGCPLRCVWCCNPESQEFRTEILWVGENCRLCGRCLEVCRAKAIFQDAKGKKSIDRARCDLCGLCVSNCSGGALRLLGKRVRADEVIRQVMGDAAFYQRSGGGLTLTGGEPAAQPEFAAELLRLYKTEQRGGHTAVETCGFANWTEFSRILEYASLILYDIKHMGPKRHLELTGVDNEIILRNARRIAESGVRLIIRLPLVPGLNDDETNVRQTAAFARSLPGVSEIDVLPFHRMGEPKYARLGRIYGCPGTKAPDGAKLDRVRFLINEAGLRVKIGG